MLCLHVNTVAINKSPWRRTVKTSLESFGRQSQRESRVLRYDSQSESIAAVNKRRVLYHIYLETAPFLPSRQLRPSGHSRWWSACHSPPTNGAPIKSPLIQDHKRNCLPPQQMRVLFLPPQLESFFVATIRIRCAATMSKNSFALQSMRVPLPSQ